MLRVPTVLGKPINIWEGILLILLLAFQLSSGLRLIRVPLKYHKLNGILIFTVAMTHAFFGLGVWFFGFTY